MKRYLIGDLSVAGLLTVDNIRELTDGVGVTVNDEVYMPDLVGTGIGISMVYYNRSTGELTYGDRPVGTSDVSVTNQGDNRVVTATGVTDVLNAEEYMTFDGNLNLLNGGGLDQYGRTILLGADITGYTSRTNSVAKAGTLAFPHYLTAEEDYIGLQAFSGDGFNWVYIGGGDSQFNASTQIRFMSSADATSTTGTMMAYIDIDGFHVDTITELNTDTGVTINNEVYLPTIGGSGTGTSIIHYNRSTGELTYADSVDMVYPDAGIALSTGSTWGTSIANSSADWNTAYTHSTTTTGNPHAVEATDIITLGTTTQIPYMNLGGTNFLYSANFTFDGSTLDIIGELTIDTILEHTGNAGVTIEQSLLRDGSIYFYDAGTLALEINPGAFGVEFISSNGRNIQMAPESGASFDIGNTHDNNSYITIRNADGTPVDSILRVYAAGTSTINFRVDDDGTVYIPELGDNDTEDHIIAINDTTGLLTKRAVSSLAGVNYGADTQIPYMNGTTAYQYSANLTFSGTILDVNSTITVNTINEHTTDSGVTIEGVGHEDGWISLADDDGIYFGSGGTTYIRETGFSAIAFIQGGSTIYQVTSDGLVLYGKGLLSYAEKTNDVGHSTMFYRNGYFDRVYIDDTAVYIDITGSGATLDMTFTSTLNGTVTLASLIGSAGDGVTSVAQGDGMEFTTITATGLVTMGTPTTLTLLTTNSASGRTHEHELDIAVVASGADGLAPAHGGVGSTYYLNAAGAWTVPAAGAGYWTDNGTSLSPTTSGDDILLRDNTERLLFGDGDTFIYESADDVIDIVVGAATQLRINVTNTISTNHFIPVATGAYDLGTNTGPYYWNNVYMNQLFIGSTNLHIEASGTDMIFSDGSNADVTLTELLAGGSGDVSWGTETGAQPIVFGASAGDIDSGSNLSWNTTSSILNVTGNVVITGSATYFSGLDIDNTELYVVAIDNNDGKLTKRSVASMASLWSTSTYGIFNSSGNVGIGGFADVNHSLYVLGTTYHNGDVSIGATTTVTAGYNLELFGVDDQGRAGDWTATSDIRLKTNIVKHGPVLGNIMDLYHSEHGLSVYNRRILDKSGQPTEEYKSELEVGFIAQDTMESMPLIVNGSEEEFYDISYMRLAAIAITGVAELKDEKDLEIEDLQRQVDILKEEVNILKN